MNRRVETARPRASMRRAAWLQPGRELGASGRQSPGREKRPAAFPPAGLPLTFSRHIFFLTKGGAAAAGKKCIFVIAITARA